MLDTVFAELRERLLRSASGMIVTDDAAGNVVMKAPWLEPGKKEQAWFAAVQVRKSYVSFHLMPLYALPALLDAVPADLRKRMQGKSCFNFKAVDPALFDALEVLVTTCAAAYRSPVTPGRS